MGTAEINSHLQPNHTPVTTQNQGVPPWKFSVKQGIQGRNIRSSNAKIVNLSALQTDIQNLTAAITSLTNASGGTVIDTLGLVSNISFPNNGASSNTAGSTTSTTPVTITGSTLPSLVLTRSTNVLTWLTAIGYNVDFQNNPNHVMQVQLVDSIEGTLTTYGVTGEFMVNNIDFVGHTWTTSIANQIASVPSLTTFAAGTHTMHAEYYAAGGGTAKLNNWAILYVVLGS